MTSDSPETPESRSADEKRHDQLTTAPKSTEKDAAPRIRVSESPSGATRIDWREDAPIRPGEGPTDEEN